MQYQVEQRMKVGGIWPSPNNFSEIPEGAMERADNTVITRDSVMQTRRGFRRYGDPVSATGNIQSVFTYIRTILAWTDENELFYDGDGVGTDWTQYPGTYEVPDNTVVGSRIRSAAANKNFYFTTRQGVMKLDTVTSTPVLAGVAAALGGTAAITGATGFLATDTAVAYRIVWGYRDANDNLILGAPSDRIIAINTSGTSADVNITFTVPFSSAITTSYFYQVYRSDASATAADAPPDSYQQVIEGNPTSGELSSRTITVLDVVPNNLRQATLYSSAGFEGPLQANYPPPYCKDIANFRNYQFYANVRDAHSFSVTLLAVGPSQGIQVGDTITFTSGADSFVLTGGVAENIPAGVFLVDTTGTPEENNEVTARSIVNVMNLYAANTFLNSYYASTFDDLAGQLYFEKRVIDSVSFRMNSNRITAWSPTIPASGSTSQNTSADNEFLNRVAYSKLQQPEAVPLLNIFDIGDAREPILRILTMRDAVMVFKTDGVYAIVGNDPSNFYVSTLDSTSILIAPNSLVPLNNNAYFFGQRGVTVMNTDGSGRLISTPVKRELLALSSDLYPTFDPLTTAISYESEAQYILSTVTSPGDEIPTQQYIYADEVSAQGNEVWTKWYRRFYCGLVNAVDNKLYLGGGQTDDGCFIYQERKDLARSDQADEDYPVEIASVSGFDIELTSLANVVVGMTMVQGGTSGIIESIDEDNNIVVMDSLAAWEVGEGEVFTPINTLIRSSQFSAGQPGILKHAPECSFFFESPFFDHIDTTFISDYMGVSEIVRLEPGSIGSWGTFPWGSLPWGGTSNNTQRIRSLIPKVAQRFNWLQIELQTNQCFVSFAFLGCGVLLNVVSQRQKK